MEMDPFSSVLHYGQSIFEGLKAYNLHDGGYGIFRPNLHAQRFAQSAKIMSMAEISESYILETFKEFTRACESYIPKEAGHSLYLRPLLMGIDPVIKVRSSEKYRYIILGSIVGSYFTQSNSEVSKSKVLVAPYFVRAYPGGTGEAKTSSNYAQSLYALDQATQLGYDQVLYLDPVTKNHFQELGGMNFFWVNKGELYTPKLNGQILHGVTRASIIEISKHLGIKIHEIPLSLNDLISGHESGGITEIFASGTAAVISPLGEIGLMDEKQNIKKIEFHETTIGIKLRQYLVDTYAGKTEFSARGLTR
jgi:branched-chain amino acid aminotransferase